MHSRLLATILNSPSLCPPAFLASLLDRRWQGLLELLLKFPFSSVSFTSLYGFDVVFTQHKYKGRMQYAPKLIRLCKKLHHDQQLCKVTVDNIYRSWKLSPLLFDVSNEALCCDFYNKSVNSHLISSLIYAENISTTILIKWSIQNSLTFLYVSFYSLFFFKKLDVYEFLISVNICFPKRCLEIKRNEQKLNWEIEFTIP